MTEPRSFIFQRTPSRSPERIFAPPITPIVIDSSPLTIPSLADPLSASRILRSRLPDSPSASSAGNGVTPNKRVALARSISKENTPVVPGRRADNGRKNGREIPPRMGSCSPIKWDSAFYSDAENESGKRKAKKSTKKSGRMRKMESKKSTNTLNKTIKGCVTKSSESSQSSIKSTKEITISPERNTCRTKENEVEYLNLEEAMRRRTDWTPTKDTLIPPIDLTQAPSNNEPVVERRFGNLVERYGYVEEGSQEEDFEVVNQAPTKKRRLELVGTSGRESQASGDSITAEEKRATSARTKKPRKAKTTTITSLTTARYEANSTSDSNINHYFSPKATDKKTTEKSSRARKSRARTKPRSTKEASPAFKVAPTAEAIKSLDDQVFLFGTCSQLVRDLSPGYEEHRESSTRNFSNHRAQKLGFSSLLAKRSGSKSLWGASARDLDGGLAEIEIVDLQKADTSNHDRPLSKKKQTAGQSEDDFLDIDDLYQNSTSGPCVSLDKSTGTTSVDMAEAEQGRDDQRSRQSSSSVSKADCRRSRERPVQNPDASVDLIEETEDGQSGSFQSSEQVGAVQAEVQVDNMPHFHGFSTADLHQQVAAYGFKPVKNREAAITLLEKCWESRNKTSNAGKAPGKRRSSSPPPPSTRKTSVKPAPKSKVSKASASGSSKSRNKPKLAQPPNDVTKRDQKQPASVSLLSSFEEIADSTDEDTIPTPSHDIYYDALSYSNQMNMTPPTTLTIRSRSKFQPSHSDEDNPPDIHKQITLAIKGQPRMNAVNGIKQPTWYEKILMYEPVLLDDLTVWLNTEGLNRVGEDREVDRLTVREWCESKGVCCTWRKAGNRRK